MCSAAELSDKQKFPSFGRTFAVDTQVGPSLISLLKYTYNWTIVAVIYQNATNWTKLKSHLLNKFDSNGVTVSMEYLIANPPDYNNNNLGYSERFREALKEIKTKARSKLQNQTKPTGVCIQYSVFSGIAYDIH